jgi:hypothetical protein
MSPIEVRINPSYKWRMALLAFVALAALYFYLGYLPVIAWIVAGALVIVLLFRVVRREGTDPCIILNDEGLLDKRLKVGVIRWADIRRIQCYNLHGGQFISLDLHNSKTYSARRPLWLTLSSQIQRYLGLSSFAINTNGLDVDMNTLVNKIHEGCQTATQRNQELP